ncbi:L-fuculose-phosphate aldolase [Cohaesibacter sp. ES.047]|uniref:L-fuculose-phosphate aldolase n=1 Tax=Cohaesibacter sp. ES.047 TaxID=1798205 RepID=UPI000BB76E44|nr:L-fuculose-phosphate aldolase [Cohaesibacter sp. ES.047]SNY92225.1 L-fuculose-phosphate aldolase [Cohaesibacter sp. ES.047]
MSDELSLRKSLIAACNEMNASGLNQGTSGNISVRVDGGMLITPSGVAYDQMEPEEIVFVSTDGKYAEDQVPSSEWRFHLAALESRPEANAVVHNHALYSTTIAIMNKPIPAIHYMIATAGGNSIPCVDYATYGTPELSKLVEAGLKDRKAILMRHHGMIATGSSLAQAMWLAVEVETLAKWYVNLLQITDNPPCLSDAEIEVVLKKIANYGLREKTA